MRIHFQVSMLSCRLFHIFGGNDDPFFCVIARLGIILYNRNFGYPYCLHLQGEAIRAQELS